MFVELEVSSTRVLDLRAANTLDTLGLSSEELGLPFRDYIYAEAELVEYIDAKLRLPPSQIAALGALALGADAVLVPAKHAAASQDEANLVLFEWNVTDATSAWLVDPNGLLPDAKTDLGRSDRKLCQRVFELHRRA